MVYVTDEKIGKRNFFAILHQGPVDSLRLPYALQLWLNSEQEMRKKDRTQEEKM